MSKPAKPKRKNGEVQRIVIDAIGRGVNTTEAIAAESGIVRQTVQSTLRDLLYSERVERVLVPRSDGTAGKPVYTYSLPPALPEATHAEMEDEILDILTDGPLAGHEIRERAGISTTRQCNYLLGKLRADGIINRRIEMVRKPNRHSLEPVAIYYVVCHRRDERPSTPRYEPTLEEIAAEARRIREVEWEKNPVRWTQQPGQPVRVNLTPKHVPMSPGSSANEIVQFLGDSEWVVLDAIHGEKRRMG
jgi:hypothetical protein